MTITSVGSSLAKTSGPREELLKIFDDSDKIFVPEGKKECGGLKRSIEFNHLNFSYIPEVQVLEGVTFTIEKGKITAIVGATGAGKTTLVNLLMRFYDCSSSTILIDGVDIREFTLESLRAHMAFVNQEILLFDDTLKMNITYGAGKVTDEKLVDVAKKARLYDFIMSLPNGFDTLIGERGVKLSGGEKQRTAIARALLKGSEILILDEATSSLDSLTERLIQEAIEEAIKDRTAVIIAHRLSTIRNADKIVVIEDGRVAEQGSLTELMERKGKFWEYWEEQKFF
jgi:subfamily B ATP-binding cassette protein MsbA